jgi:hypothetical protein
MDLTYVDFVRANLARTNLHGVDLSGVTLSEADLRGAKLGPACFERTKLRGVNLRSAILDGDTDLSGVQLDEHTSLGDIQWNGANVTVVDWSQLKKVGDEDGEVVQLDRPIRAYRQIASLLRSQGMNEFADRLRILPSHNSREFTYPPWRPLFSASHRFMVMVSFPEAHIPHGPLLIFENLRSADDRFAVDHMPTTKSCCRSVAGRGFTAQVFTRRDVAIPPGRGGGTTLRIGMRICIGRARPVILVLQPVMSVSTPHVPGGEMAGSAGHRHFIV